MAAGFDRCAWSQKLLASVSSSFHPRRILVGVADRYILCPTHVAVMPACTSSRRPAIVVSRCCCACKKLRGATRIHARCKFASNSVDYRCVARGRHDSQHHSHSPTPALSCGRADEVQTTDVDALKSRGLSAQACRGMACCRFHGHSAIQP